jgi:hypothetical protein
MVAYTCKVSSCGMTLGTIPSAFEVSLSSLRISGFEIGHINGTSTTANRLRFGFLVMNECDNRAHIRISQIDAGLWAGPAGP